MPEIDDSEIEVVYRELDNSTYVYRKGEFVRRFENRSPEEVRKLIEEGKLFETT